MKRGKRTGIRPAEKLRPKSGPRPRPKQKVEPPPERAGVGTAPILGGILLLGCALVFAVLGGPEGPDPHLLKAKKTIERYEEVTAAAARDYESHAYRSALSDLDQVPPKSPSEPEAAALAGEIRARIESQRAQARVRVERIAERQSKEQTRDARFFEAQMRPRPHSDGSSNVCEPPEKKPEKELLPLR